MPMVKNVQWSLLAPHKFVRDPRGRRRHAKLLASQLTWSCWNFVGIFFLMLSKLRFFKFLLLWFVWLVHESNYFIFMMKFGEGKKKYKGFFIFYGVSIITSQSLAEASWGRNKFLFLFLFSPFRFSISQWGLSHF